MKIKLIMQLLELEIADQMERFHKIGKEVKRRIQINAPQDQIMPLYEKMADIYEQLKPVEQVVRDQNPRLLNLFDYLKQLKK